MKKLKLKRTTLRIIAALAALPTEYTYSRDRRCTSCC
jgi:hypothetical protein